MLDVAIRGGDVVDGTGRDRYRADVGIVGDRIIDIGVVQAEARDTIDATGKVVCPGFIDIHTHYDAQIFWDAALTPSPLFGFTTAFAGNCGFSIAPLPAEGEGRSYLQRMLARVEGIPLESLEAGVTWDWRTTGEYLAALDGATALNIGFLVGHSALRRCVMGADANGRAATAGEVSLMKRLLTDGLEAGAVGFSSSWAGTHSDGEGEKVPSRLASREELIELSSVLAAYEGMSLEFIPSTAPAFEPWALELMADMSAAAGSPLNWNLLNVNASTGEAVANKLRSADVAAERGGRVFGLTLPKSSEMRLSFRTGFVMDTFPGWNGVFHVPLRERLALLSDPAQRARLDDQAQAPRNHLRRFADWARAVVYDVVAADNMQYLGRTIGEIAAQDGRDPFDVLCGIVVSDELGTSFGYPAAIESRADWSARVEVWRDGRAIVGGSDAGAHLDMHSAFDYPTKMLSRAVREHGLLSLEEAVQYLTDVPARLYGLRHRGQLHDDWYADVVVFDPEQVDDEEARMVYDMPGGACRLYAEARGIDHVLVNGRRIVTGGKLTDERSGLVLRAGRDTGRTT